MGDVNLIRESLRDGVLVAPFELTIGQGLSYYLAYPPDRAQQPKIRVLREWLSKRHSPIKPT
jgi:DNA-binding transcriptional LysR family regulator